MKNKILVAALVAIVAFSAFVFGQKSKVTRPASIPLEVNQWARIYVPEETDLALALREAANNNNRTGWIRVSFEYGDYTGGNDSPLYVDLVTVEPHDGE